MEDRRIILTFVEQMQKKHKREKQMLRLLQEWMQSNAKEKTT